MTIKELKTDIEQRYDGLKMINAYAEEAYFYNPDGRLPHGVYFATIKSMNGKNDKASELDREDVYRLSFGVTKQRYEEHFGAKPKRPAKGEVVKLEYDFKVLNILTPHPVYAWIGWVAILNPKHERLPLIWQLLDEKYKVVVKEYEKKVKSCK